MSKRLIYLNTIILFFVLISFTTSNVYATSIQDENIDNVTMIQEEENNKTISDMDQTITQENDTKNTIIPTPTPSINDDEKTIENKETFVSNVNDTLPPTLEITPLPSPIVEEVTPSIPIDQTITTIPTTTPIPEELVVASYEYSDDIEIGEIISQKQNEDGTYNVIYSLGKKEPEIAIMKLKSSGIEATNGNCDISIDGNFSDWNNKPYSYEYNWNNPYYVENFWDQQIGQNITKYWYDENDRPYNLQIRHKMQLYTDGVYVYLHIIIANNYTAQWNGFDYNFYVDGERASYQLQFPSYNMTTGCNRMEVRHRDNSMSYQVTNADAVLYVPNNYQNIELEMKIPLSSMEYQNPNIDIEHFNEISFFTPNLMYRHIYTCGSSTGPYIGIGLCVLVIIGGAIIIEVKKKNAR